MNKIEKILIDCIKKIEGNVLGFGNLDEKIIKEIDKNKNISEFILFSDDNISGEESKKTKRNKQVAYKKIRKKIKKKNINNIIACYDDLKGYRRRFVQDSLYLSKQNIYVYIKSEEIDEELIIKRFKRYHQDIELIECKDGFVIHIKKVKYRKNKIRDMFYLVIDFVIDVINIIGDLFVI